MKILTVCALIVYSVSVQANDLGQTTYENACKNCHGPKVATSIKAPAAFDSSAWQKRLLAAKDASKQDPKKFPSAMDYLVYQVSIGKGLMHHGGLCKESGPELDCSKKAIKQAILYMIKKPSVSLQ